MASIGQPRGRRFLSDGAASTTNSAIFTCQPDFLTACQTLLGMESEASLTSWRKSSLTFVTSVTDRVEFGSVACVGATPKETIAATSNVQVSRFIRLAQFASIPIRAQGGVLPSCKVFQAGSGHSTCNDCRARAAHSNLNRDTCASESAASLGELNPTGDRMTYV